MNVERMKMLQTLITTVSDGKWYGGETFAYHNFLGFKWPKKNPKIDFNLACWFSKRKRGYAACAIGHAMLDKNFIDQGFTFNEPGVMVPSFEGKLGYDAIEAFFEIERKTATTLFSPYSYSTDCYKDPIWFLLRIDWLLHNSRCDEHNFKLDFHKYGKDL